MSVSPFRFAVAACGIAVAIAMEALYVPETSQARGLRRNAKEPE
jgi:hypothetical protein